MTARTDDGKGKQRQEQKQIPFGDDQQEKQRQKQIPAGMATQTTAKTTAKRRSSDSQKSERQRRNTGVSPLRDGR
jgi:hypothetical protein